MAIEYSESIKKALAIIKECSAKDEDIKLYNSLEYIGLNIEICVPKLNELYNADVDIKETFRAIKVKDLLAFWEPSLAPYHTSHTENNEFKEKSYNESEYKTTNPDINYKKTLIYTVLTLSIVYWCTVSINWFSNNRISSLKESEELFKKIVNVVDLISSLFSPEDWIFTGAEWFLGPELYGNFLNIIALLIFGGLSLFITYIFLTKEHREYFHQPISALLIMLIIILNGGIVNNPCLNYIWTMLIPLTYIVIILLGVLFVRICLRLSKPKNSIIIGIIQVLPFVLWLILFKIIKMYFKI